MEPPEPDFEPADPGYAERVRSSFGRQGLMRTLGAELGEVRPGTCEIQLPFREGLSQQHGFFHAGAPAKGDLLVARGRVLKAGRTLFVCRADVFAVSENEESLCATMQQTVMRMTGRPEPPSGG
jgi:acyl-coenzyme A thioesterase PaaI-like protein